MFGYKGKEVMTKDRIQQANQDLDRVVDFVKSSAFQDAIKKVDSDPKALEAATRDAKSFLEQQRVQVDDDMTVEVTQGTWKICVSVGFISVCYIFD